MWDNANLMGSVARWLFRIVILLLISALGVWLYYSPYFPIKQVKIDGNIERINTKALENIAQKYIRGNILRADLNSAQKELAKLPWVSEVSVRRKIPDTVEIHLVEREPVARWGGGKLVDSHGDIFAAVSDEALPTFTGTLGAGKTMVQHYQAFDNILKPLGMQINELIYTPRSAWSLKLDNGLLVKLGRENEEKRLQNFVSAWQPLLANQVAQLEYVDMRYKDGFAVKHHSHSDRPSENNVENEKLQIENN